MVRPHHFTPNPHTRADNAYQSVPVAEPEQLAREAYDEVTRMSEAIAAAGVTVHLYDDAGTATPDSVFPNNWFSTEASGDVAVYPMYAPSRRGERRADILDDLTRQYRVTRVRDYSGMEAQGQFLEGTGSMVLDHRARRAYACRSNRMSEPLMRRFCAEFGYHAIVFDGLGPDGLPVYHTNVLMSVGARTALVGLSALPHEADRVALRTSLEETGREVVELTPQQVADFAGNAFELGGADGNVLVMSARGVASLTAAQRSAIERHTPLLPVDIPTIEHAGGSARCMLAGVYLVPRGECARVPGSGGTPLTQCDPADDTPERAGDTAV